MVVVKCLRLLLLIVSCYGWITFIWKKNIKIEFSVMLFVSALGSFMFFAGILNILELASLLIFAVGLVLALRTFVKDKTSKKVTEPKPEEDPYVRDAKNKLEEYFQTSVTISSHSVSIHYEDKEDLTRLLELLHLIEEE